MEGYRFVVEQKVAWRDLDMLGHVNNAVYSSYFETGRIEYLGALGALAGAPTLPLILAEITITFRSPAFLREVLVIGTRVSEVRNSSFIVEAEIRSKEDQRLVATSRAVIVHYDYNEKKSAPIPDQWRKAVERFEQGG